LPLLPWGGGFAVSVPVELSAERLMLLFLESGERLCRALGPVSSGIQAVETPWLKSRCEVREPVLDQLTPFAALRLLSYDRAKLVSLTSWSSSPIGQLGIRDLGSNKWTSPSLSQVS
jgi:hypothetical protein